MNNLDRLFDLAASENIFIHFVAEIPCYKADALFVAKDSCRMILILEKLKNNVSRLTEVLAEELGHYFTSTGVNVSIDYLLGRTDIKNYEEYTIAAHTDDRTQQLSDEDRKQLDDFIDFLIAKSKKDE